MPTLTLFMAIFTLAMGIGVLWANPRRLLNQMFWLTSLVQGAWLGCVYELMRAGSLVPQGEAVDIALWLRLNAVVVAFLPLCLWLAKESVAASRYTRRIFFRSLPWLALGCLLATNCYSDSFILPARPNGFYGRGTAYYVNAVGGTLAYLFLVFDILRQLRGQSGIRRVETQFLVLNLGVAAFSMGVLTVIGNFLEFYALKRLSLVIIVLAYVVSAWAITAHRIFDVRHVVVSLGQRVGLLLLLGLSIFLTSQGLESFIPRTGALFLSVALCGPVAVWFDRKSRTWLDLGGERVLADTRRTLIEIALEEPNSDKLISEFESLLRQRWQTDFAMLLFDRGESFQAPGLELRKNRSAYLALCETGWATPESLERRRKTPASDDLHQFLTDHALGLVVASPRGSRTPSLLIALGTKTQLWPFTYPEVERLQNIAELMDNILTRSRLTTQAALNARVEHLAMMSRGLAHDLKNLITPISSFLVHTGDALPAAGPEVEVHSAAKRSVRIMTDYVREALFFSERLTPHFEPVEIGKVLAEVRGITATRAAQRGVMVSETLRYSGPLIADAVLIQRMLANLVGNAIDASQVGQTVAISVTRRGEGWVRLQVIDTGCGITPENIGRIFDPYFTTKEFGDEVRGFGLGLTICQKIVHLHNGTISVESQPGRGTTISVDLPATPKVEAAHYAGERSA